MNQLQLLLIVEGGLIWVRKKKPCGHATLVVGKNQRCEKCKKLICNECNHCSNNCLLKSQRIDANKNNQDSQYEQYPEAQ